MSGPGDSKKVVVAALLGNALIAIAKFVAAGLSGSVAMLAEAVHSLADTANQALLLLGMSLAKRSDPIRYPLGRAKEVYFWAFVVSMMLFLLGGVYAVYEGVHALSSETAPVGSLLTPAIVLSVSLVFEGASFSVAFREFNKRRGSRRFAEALFEDRDPTIPVVLLEDTGAVLGLIVALVSVAISWSTGSSVADGVGSLIIGVLLCAIGVALAFETHGLLIGEAATPEVRARAYQLARESEDVEDVRQMISVHMGPDTVVLALKVAFRRGISVERVERATNAIETRIRAEIPEMKRIFVEADASYDAQKDPLAPGLPGGAA